MSASYVQVFTNDFQFIATPTKLYKGHHKNSVQIHLHRALIGAGLRTDSGYQTCSHQIFYFFTYKNENMATFFSPTYHVTFILCNFLEKSY